MVKQKTYHLLFGDVYYAQHHLEDYQGAFETKELAQDRVIQLVELVVFWWATIFIINENNELMVIKKWGNDFNNDDEYMEIDYSQES